MPLRAGLEPGRATALADRMRFRDHAADGVRHLCSVEGVKYTTARGVAAQVVDHLVRDLGAPAAPCRTDVTPLTGAHYVAADDPRLAERIREAVREEMAVTLADIVYRRTMIGEPPGPDRRLVEQAATIAGELLGWDEPTRLGEIGEVMRQAAGPLAEQGMVPA